MTTYLTLDARVKKLSNEDVQTLNYARWPEDGQLHEKSAKKLVKDGLAYWVGGELFITETGKRAQQMIEDSNG